MRASSGSYLLIGLLVTLLVCPPPLMAAVIVVDGTCTLVDAITAANTDTATGGCPAGSGADEIELTVDVILTAVDNTTDGPNGLPSVTSEVTIRSNDASPRTVERGSGAPAFRIFHAGSGGALSVEKLVVSNGDPYPWVGGGIYNRAQLALTNTTVSDNAAASGGGIYNYAGNATLTHSTVSGNSVGDRGGGISNDSGTVSLSNSTVSSNSAATTGGGINSYLGTLNLTDSTVSGNSTGYSGGGIFNLSSSATLTYSTVSGNSSGDSGGGIDNRYYATLTLTNSTVSGNGTGYDGGGIFNTQDGATVTLMNSTVSANSASSGGGIHNNFGTVMLTNSTVSGNSAGYFGGGIYNYYDATVTLTNSTVSGNSAGYLGGGIYNYSGYATLTGSLVANSPLGGNCDGSPVTDGGNNLADDASCGSIPATLTGLDPVLADNGGPTQTHALLPGSNAIDLAGNCGLQTDQRLFLRDDGSCDSGSFEFGAADPAEIFSDGFESGDTSAWSQTVP